MNLATIESMADLLLRGFWRASWQASVLALLVLLIQTLAGRRIGGRGRYLLWSIVILRLLMPIMPQSRISIFNVEHLTFGKDLAPIAAIALTIIPNAPPSLDELPRQFAPSAHQDRTKSKPFWNLSRAMMILWLIGVVAIAARLIGSSFAWRRSLRNLADVEDTNLLRIARSCAAALGIARMPRVLVGAEFRTPAVVGVFQPAIILPERVLNGCTDSELRLIVLHELAHIKRRDIACNWLIAAATALHWFNPFIWLIAARIRADRELACDEMVLSRCAVSDVRAYGCTLLKLIELLAPAAADRHRQLVGILESSGPMQRRMRMIAQYKSQRSSRWVWVTLLLLALGCTSLTDSVRGQNRSGDSTPVRPATQPIARGDRVTKGDIQTQLQSVLPEVTFDSIAFSDVIGFLRDVSGVNIVVNWRALETAGIDRTVPVSIKLRNVPFEQVLRQILRDVGGGAVRLDYSVEGEVLTITTEEEAASEVRTVIYDVTDLMIDGKGAALSGKDFNDRMDELADLIQFTISSQSWKTIGGSGPGVFRKFSSKLVITHTPKTHQQIEHMLKRLREGPTTQPQALTGSTF